MKDSDLSYEAKLLTSGVVKVQSKDDYDRDVFVPGEDYEIKRDTPKAPWVILPANQYTEEYCNDWVFKRNARPRDPTFAFCPMPRRGDNTQERNAALILTYLHPFTLNPEEADADAPFLGNLCQAGRTWQDSMLHWFDGRAACEETNKYVSKLLSVARARPEDADDDLGEEDFSDEELHANKHNFRDALKTSMGKGE